MSRPDGTTRLVDCGVCGGDGDLVSERDEPNVLTCHQCRGVGTVFVNYPDFESWHAVAADMLLLRDVAGAAKLIASEGDHVLLTREEYSRLCQKDFDSPAPVRRTIGYPQNSLASCAETQWIALLDESGKEVSYLGYSRQEFASLKDVTFPANHGAVSVVVTACALMTNSVLGEEICRVSLPRVVVDSGVVLSVKNPRLTIS